jgi:CBS domain-containing protein
MVGFLPRSRVDEAVRAGHPEWRLEALAVAAEQLTTVRPDEDLEAALVRLGPHLEQGALVVADGQLVGTLAASDVARVAALAPLLGPRPQD